MIDIKSLREGIQEVVSQIPEINKTRFVVTDDQLADALDKHKKADNALLLCLIPTYQSEGTMDNPRMMSYFQFFILDKVDYKQIKNEGQYLDIFIKLQEVVKKFISSLLDYKQGDCWVFENLKEDTLLIRPVHNKAQCNGWEIQIDCEDYESYFR
ncbi:MAG: hypothetical protein CSA38_01980 [Flavobacteriales bacterium]|nr:MAG: hypothetical protein CSA38_01980 [Flavobacteriales bacterium]